MAKKNSHNDTAGVVFDTHSKMVMSQGGTFERMKEKISAVRAVVPNKSNNEIVLVLQHFENSVDKAVQAFLEGSAVEILKEWNVTGKKKPKKKKKPKLQADPTPTPPPEEAQPEEGKEQEEEVNGFHANGESVLDGESLDSLSEQLDSVSLDAAELDSEPATSETTAAEAESPSSSIAPPTSTTPQGGRNHQGSRGGGKNRHRAGSNSSSSSLLTTDSSQHTTSGNKKMASNIDRSVKDLQRCAVSLTRYRMVVKDEMDTSIKRMKQTFAELQNCLMDREVNLLAEMDKVKAEAMAILDGRHKKAEELRRLTDQSASMSEDQLSELRADIKHFVSERKYDEDLGKALRFTFEIEPLKSNIIGFGSVYHPRTGYSTRSRCSSTSSSVTSPPVVDAPATPSQPQPSSEHRPPPAKQIFQGNRRTFQGQGYHSGGGGHRYNGGSSYHDRNPNRSHYRGYHGNGSNNNSSGGGGPGGDGGPASSQYANSNSRGPQNPSSTSSSSTSSYNNRQDRSSSAAASNGLPQRPPRAHCP